MNILVTGGAGYIGSHTVVELMNAGHHPIIVDDLSNARWDVRDRIGEITGRVPAFYEIDCADKKELRKVLPLYALDARIRCVKKEEDKSGNQYPDKYKVEYRNIEGNKLVCPYI